MRLRTSLRRVVVGVDGSPNSLAALRRAVREAHERQAAIEVVRVLPGTPGRLARIRGWLALRAIAARIVPMEQQFTTRLRVASGSPAEVLNRASEYAEALLIGARAQTAARGPLGGEVLGNLRTRPGCELIICADHATAPRD
ncbi:universal stress protein [Actinocorallia sp. B10E7]|uniref:universal stress protein n=1 Tax=Actinocorallia sp. B10E7 TaxID=3153558 RepID=UPI00325D38EF